MDDALDAEPDAVVLLPEDPLPLLLPLPLPVPAPLPPTPVKPVEPGAAPPVAVAIVPFATLVTMTLLEPVPVERSALVFDAEAEEDEVELLHEDEDAASRVSLRVHRGHVDELSYRS